MRLLFVGTTADVELRAYLDGRTGAAQLFTRKPASARQFIEAHANENIAFGIATRKGGGTKDHCRELPALAADVDGPQAWERVQAFQLRPSIINSSGHGFHAYWLLRQPVAADAATIEPISKGIALHLGSDRVATDLARCFRVPGTVNRKDGVPRLCSTVQADWTLRYTLQDFEGFRLSSGNGADTEGKRDATDGHRIPKGSRRPTFARFAGAMRRQGMTAKEIEAALMVVNAERCSPPLTAEQVRYVAHDIAQRYAPAADAAWEGATTLPKLTVVSLATLLAHPFPPRLPILKPWLLRQSLVLIYAWRGVGKTYFTLELAYAIASGGSFLGWNAPEPRRVLYVDGELPGEDIQKRLAHIVAAEDKQVENDALHVITPDLQPFSLVPDMATRAAQAVLDEAIEEWKSEVVIFDSLSTLVRSGKESESESWAPMAEWALRQRAQGRSAIFIHHAGKDGKQRGASKKEDILNTTLRLCLPPQYDHTQGAVFEVRWEKSRDLKALAPFEATLTEKDDQRLWLTKPITETTLDRVVSLANEGLSQGDIARELKINRSNVSRAWKQAKVKGLLVQWPKKTEEPKSEVKPEEK
jgi:hypothetical protein